MDVIKDTQKRFLPATISSNIKAEDDEDVKPNYVKTEYEDDYWSTPHDTKCWPVSSNTHIKLETNAELQVKPEVLPHISIKTEPDNWDHIKSEDVSHQSGEDITDPADLKPNTESAEADIAAQHSGCGQLCAIKSEVNRFEETSSGKDLHVHLHASGRSRPSPGGEESQRTVKKSQQPHSRRERGESFQVPHELKQRHSSHVGKKGERTVTPTSHPKTQNVCRTFSAMKMSPGRGNHYNSECDKRLCLRNGHRPHTSALPCKEKPFVCEMCGKSFTLQGNLTSHLQTHKEEKPHECEMCGKSFTWQHSLKSHLRTHTGEKPYTCTTCGKSFSWQHSLKSHLLTHTGEKPYACETCGKNFTMQSNLKSHLRTHTGEKPFACEICGKSFSLQCNLKSHVRTHTGEKPYACDTCGKSFSLQSSLKAHLRTHTGEKPYACATCGKSFTWPDSLKSHLRTHSGQKLYTCETCGRSFLWQHSLEFHLRTHTGEKPHVCITCGKSFKRQNNLKSHLQTHIGGKPSACREWKSIQKFENASPL